MLRVLRSQLVPQTHVHGLYFVAATTNGSHQSTGCRRFSNGQSFVNKNTHGSWKNSPQRNPKKTISEKFNKLVLTSLKRWPFLKNYYEQMLKGFNRQVSDFKTGRSVSKKRKLQPNYKTTYQEHKAVFDVKGSLLKTSFLLPLFLLPMGIVIVFIPVALFPQHLLPHCYWSKKQRKIFFTDMHMNRKIHHGIVLHHLNFIKDNHPSAAFQRALTDLLTLVNDSTKVPTNDDLRKFREWCSSIENPLSLDGLPPVLLHSFCHINFLWKYFPSPWLRYYLHHRVKLILEFDEKLRRENLVYDLSDDELQEATFLRGLDSANLSTEANRYWLKNWLRHTSIFASNAVDPSYILHAMVFQSHNYSDLRHQRRVFDQT
uniref:LETM1 domain-containing protein 1-like n=1 Tax=Styela clava TaxID=7725 RepID=UPI00193A3E2F|nr:LETM1 domain-containing protein 1-like [Styela clava]